MATIKSRKGINAKVASLSPRNPANQAFVHPSQHDAVFGVGNRAARKAKAAADKKAAMEAAKASE